MYEINRINQIKNNVMGFLAQKLQYIFIFLSYIFLNCVFQFPTKKLASQNKEQRMATENDG